MQVAMLGPLGPAQLACFESWRSLGFTTHFLHTEKKRLPIQLRSIVEHYDHLGPIRSADPVAFGEIGRLLQAAGSSHLTCLGDQLAINLWKHHALLGAGVSLLAPPAGVIDAMESKVIQIGLATQVGFDVLPTALVSAETHVDVIGVEFPLVLRPDRASLDTSFKAEFIADAMVLRQFFELRSPVAPAVVAQPFVSGPSVVLHGFRGFGDRTATMIGFIARLKNDGVTATLEPWAMSPEIELTCQEFARRAGLVGVFHFDLLLDDQSDKVWFLEVNARLGGTTGKAYAAGYDEPAALLHAFGLVGRAPNSRRRHVPVVNRLAALHCLGRALRGTGSTVDYPFPSRARVLASSIRALMCYRDEVVRPLHPRSTFAFFSQYFGE